MMSFVSWGFQFTSSSLGVVGFVFVSRFIVFISAYRSWCECVEHTLFYQLGQLVFKRVRSESSNPCRPVVNDLCIASVFFLEFVYSSLLEIKECADFV
jgi:hypothetical protein